MFGKRLCELRTKRGLTQAELGLELGIAQTMVHFFEKGVKLPSVPMLIRISRFFGCTTDYLLGMDMD